MISIGCMDPWPSCDGCRPLHSQAGQLATAVTYTKGQNASCQMQTFISHMFQINDFLYSIMEMGKKVVISYEIFIIGWAESFKNNNFQWDTGKNYVKMTFPF